jgi:hypothetical protein
MSRTDKTMPWRLREEDLPDLPWHRILNEEMNSFGRREMRRWWHAERFKARLALQNRDQPEPTRTRHCVRYDMY